MEESNSSQPPRCPCGFWGSAKTLGLCSKCFQDREKAKNARDAEMLRGSQGNSSKASSMDSQGARSDPTKHPSLSKDRARDKDTQSIIMSSSDSKNSALCSALEQPSESLPRKDISQLAGSNSSTNSPESQLGDVAGASTLSTVLGDENGENEGERGAKSVLEEEPSINVQKNKKRCYKCSCKLELAQREIGRCRCGLIFCSLHRLPEQHQCEFDHKEDGRQAARLKMVKPTRHLGTTQKRIDSDKS